MQNSQYMHVLLICKTAHPAAQALAEQISRWLTSHGNTNQICTAEQLAALPAHNERTMAIVLGGDGTILGVGRKLAGRNIPIMGINFGRVGYLSTTEPEHWQEWLTACLAGHVHLQHRMVLNWELQRDATLLAQGCAVNDVVISHGALARLVCVDLSINNEQMGFLRCDGIIVSTPVGSSGYTASAGGPILYSTTDAFVFTAICPFLKAVSPMVFPSSATFHIRIEQGSTDSYLTVDGQEGYLLTPNDSIDISASPDSVIFLGNDEVFLERMRSRGLMVDPNYIRTNAEYQDDGFL